MTYDSERTVLQHLIEVCRDGERGFRAAADSISRADFRALFLELADERARFASDLLPHLHRMGGYIDTEGTNTGALHRGWMALRGLVPGDHDHAIVVETERGERAALSAYDRALGGMLPLTVDWLVEAQREAVRKAHERVAALDYQTDYQTIEAAKVDTHGEP